MVADPGDGLEPSRDWVRASASAPENPGTWWRRAGVKPATRLLARQCSVSTASPETTRTWFRARRVGALPLSYGLSPGGIRTRDLPINSGNRTRSARDVRARDRICTCNTPGLSRRPLLVGIPWRKGGRVNASGSFSGNPIASVRFEAPAGFEPAASRLENERSSTRASGLCRARPEIRTPTVPGLSRLPLPVGPGARGWWTREESNLHRPLIKRLRCRCATRPSGTAVLEGRVALPRLPTGSLVRRVCWFRHSSVALRRGSSNPSTARQAVCDTGRITQDESPSGAIRTPNPAFGGRGPIHLAEGCRAPGRIRTCTSARRRRGANPARHGRVAPGSDSHGQPLA